MALLGGLFGNAILKDAESIIHDIEYRILRVAWEEFVRLHSKPDDDSEQFKVATPAWIALEMIINHKGKIMEFNKAEAKFLTYLRNAPNLYREVVEVLSNANYTDEDAEHAYDTHHDLADVVTSEFAEYRKKELVKVLIDVARYYQQRLDEFVQKHGSDLDKAIAKTGVA